MTDLFMDVSVVQANPNLSFSYEEFMEDIIAGRRVPEFEETCNEEAHQDQTQQGTQQVLGGNTPPSLPPPPPPLSKPLP
jgi:hypothetical protein